MGDPDDSNDAAEREASSAEEGIDVSTIPERIDRLADRAARDAASFDPPADPPDEDAAVGYLVTGVGEAIGVYIDARTGEELYRFTDREYDQLEGAMNTWLRLYAACYGVQIDPSVTLRTAAEALIDTHDLRAVASTVTGVGDLGADEPL